MEFDTFVPVSLDHRLRDMRLSENDLSLLRGFAKREYDFIDHPRFEEEPDFPDLDKENPVVQWVDDVDTQDKPIRQIKVMLTRSDEEVLFLRYNFYRRKIRLVQNEWVNRRRPYMAQRDILCLLHDLLTVQTMEERIASFNIGLVYSMAEKSIRKGNKMSYQDLRTENRYFLLRAIRKFNVSFGFKFSTYACNAMFKAMNKLAITEGTHSSRFRAISSIGNNNSDSTQSYLRNETAVFNDEDHGQKEEHAHSLEIIDTLLDPALDWGDFTLNSQEIRVIRIRFSEDGGSGQGGLVSYDDISKKMRITKERVRQILNKGLEKIRCLIEDEFNAVIVQRPDNAPDIRGNRRYLRQQKLDKLKENKQMIFGLTDRDIVRRRKSPTICETHPKQSVKIPWALR